MFIYSNITYILAAGWYHYLALTLEYLKHIYGKKIGRKSHPVHSIQT